jgi:D-alanine-D-alanine ligase-like ATP-grasp enzyme
VAPIPGLTETSLMTIACEAAGVSIEDLVAGLLEDALAQAQPAPDAD